MLITKNKLPIYFVLLMACALQFVAGNCFSQKQTFRSYRLKIINYGTTEQTSTIAPNLITLNLRDSLIIIQPEHQELIEFLGHQNQFEMTYCYGNGINSRVIMTSTEYIFNFDAKMRAIIISKKEISPQVHSVWLEEITEK